MPQHAVIPAANIAVLNFDRTAALVDGRVRAPGCNFIPVPGGKPGVDGFLNGAFDAADIPLARYVLWKASGLAITAIPVFTDRIFQHHYIYTCTDTGIRSIADLRGRKVMCAPSYFSTPSFWHRALIRDEAGIEPHEIEWYSAFPEPEGAQLPENVCVKHVPSSMLGLERLLDGTVDCLMTARTAIVPAGSPREVCRVMEAPDDRLRAWYARTRSFPIAHVVAIHERSIARRPDLPATLCEAFDRAKECAYRRLQDERMTALPFMRAYLDETIAMCGEDPWPYGFEQNRAQVLTFLEFAAEQGLTRRRLAPEELFEPQSCQHQFTARMRSGCITGVMDGGWALESHY